MRKTHSDQVADIFVLGLGIVFAVYLRFCFRNFVTGDFVEFTSNWYAAIKENGFAAAGTDVSNYTPPYLYLLYVTSVVFGSVPSVAAVKIPSVGFDFVCAWFVYKLVKLKYEETRIPMMAFLAVLLAPTAISNGAVWGQADSIYTSMLIAAVYFLLVRRPAYAMLAFGVSFALKAQAIFLAPLICALWLKRFIPFWTLLLVPLVYVVAMIPAWSVGRSAYDLATIYLSQGNTYHSLSKNAPNLYAWLPERFYGVLVVAGILLTIVASCFFIRMILKSPAKLDQFLILKLSLLSLIMTPFFLPKMHDRYFFPADLLSIAYGFFFPKQYYVPVAISFASFFAYQKFLVGYAIVPINLLAIVTTAALIAVAWSAWRDLKDCRSIEPLAGK